MEERHISREIRDLHRMSRIILDRKTNKPQNFSYTRFQIINYLNNRLGEIVFQKEIVEELKLQKSSVAECLDLMEADGIIVREVVLEDKRKKIIKLTKKAVEKKKQFENAIKELNEMMTKNITQEELRVFLEVCDKMKGNLENSI